MNILQMPVKIDAETAARIAELFGTLGDTSRVRIIASLLNKEINVQGLAAIIGISESAISHQMRTLRQLHLVRARRQGREVFYSLADDHITELFKQGLDHVLHG